MPLPGAQGEARCELWRIPGHNGWGDQMHSSVYRANALALAKIYVTEGLKEDYRSCWERGIYLVKGGTLKAQLADEEAAGKIRDAFPGITLRDIKLSRTRWLNKPEPESEQHV